MRGEVRFELHVGKSMRPFHQGNGEMPALRKAIESLSWEKRKDAEARVIIPYPNKDNSKTFVFEAGEWLDAVTKQDFPKCEVVYCFKYQPRGWMQPYTFCRSVIDDTIRQAVESNNSFKDRNVDIEMLVISNYGLVCRHNISLSHWEIIRMSDPV